VGVVAAVSPVSFVQSKKRGTLRSEPSPRSCLIVPPMVVGSDNNKSNGIIYKKPVASSSSWSFSYGRPPPPFRPNSWHPQVHDKHCHDDIHGPLWHTLQGVPLAKSSAVSTTPRHDCRPIPGPVQRKFKNLPIDFMRAMRNATNEFNNNSSSNKRKVLRPPRSRHNLCQSQRLQFLPSIRHP